MSVSCTSALAYTFSWISGGRITLKRAFALFCVLLTYQAPDKSNAGVSEPRLSTQLVHSHRTGVPHRFFLSRVHTRLFVTCVNSLFAFLLLQTVYHTNCKCPLKGERTSIHKGIPSASFRSLGVLLYFRHQYIQRLSKAILIGHKTLALLFFFFLLFC